MCFSLGGGEWVLAKSNYDCFCLFAIIHGEGFRLFRQMKLEPSKAFTSLAVAVATIT